jgi:hypothetical protein
MPYKLHSRNLKYFRDYSQDRYKRRKRAGLCMCGKKPISGKKSCHKCLERDRKRTVAKIALLREEAITRYGGKCVCTSDGPCLEDWKPYLHLDHINGGGTKHRKELRGSKKFYAWLKRKNYPPILQLLCANCHQAKSRGTSCRHSRRSDSPGCIKVIGGNDGKTPGHSC